MTRSLPPRVIECGGGLGWGGAAFVILLLTPLHAIAGPSIQIDLGQTSSAQVQTVVKMLIVLTALTLLPIMLLATTSFIRFSIVFSFLGKALGLPNMPPRQVLMGLSLFLTAAVMAPVGTQLWDLGLGPYLDGKMEARPAFEAGSVPLRDFMLRQTREADLSLFYEVTRTAAPDAPEEVKLHLLIPAFVISELRTSFEMGFLLFIPFLLLDIVVGSILMSMGMVMLPPAMVSLPIKVMLFVLSDGWNLVVSSLVRSFA